METSRNLVNNNIPKELINEPSHNTQTLSITEINYLDSLDYYPSNLILAEEHSYCDCLYKIDYKNMKEFDLQNILYCKCCGQPLVPINDFNIHKCQDLNELGQANLFHFIYLYILWFTFLCIFFLSLIKIVILIFIGPNVFELIVFFFLPKHSHDLSLINLIVFLFLFLFLLYYVNLIIVKTLDKTNSFCNLNNTPEEFTIIVSNLPVDKDEDELKIELTEGELIPFDIRFVYRGEEFLKNKSELKDILKNIRKCKLNKINTYKSWCCGKEEKLEDLEKRKDELKIQIDAHIENSKNQGHSRENFTQSAIINFKTIQMKNDYIALYPQEIYQIIWAYILYFISNIICRSKFSEINKQIIKKRITYKVEHAPDPEDLIWDNIEYSNNQVIIRNFTIWMVILIGFLIKLGLTYLQKQSNSQIIYSSLISSITQVVNFLIKYIASKYPLKGHSKTENIISSINKLTTILFFNTAILPIFEILCTYNFKLDWDVFILNLIFSSIQIIATNCLIGYYFPIRIYKIFMKYYVKDKANDYSQNEANDKDEIDYIDKYTSLFYNLLMFALFYHFVHLFCFFGLIISYENYFCEKNLSFSNYLFYDSYKLKEKFSKDIGFYYLNNFKIFFLFYAVGNFFSSNYGRNYWFIILLVITFILQFIPIHKMIPDMVPNVDKEKKMLKYEECYLSFNNDYLRANPITRKEGFKQYFNALYKEEKISEIALKKLNILMDSKQNLESFYKFRHAHDIIKIFFRNKSYHEFYVNLMINSIVKNNIALQEYLQLNCGKIDQDGQNTFAQQAYLDDKYGILDDNYSNFRNDYIVCNTSPPTNIMINQSDIKNLILEENNKRHQSHGLINNKENECIELTSFLVPSINNEHVLDKNEKRKVKQNLNNPYITGEGCVKILYKIR